MQYQISWPALSQGSKPKVKLEVGAWTDLILLVYDTSVHMIECMLTAQSLTAMSAMGNTY